ncbi:microviridin/marinostatin family tricyclic proteinase inhibitor [Chryseobacterium sp.]|uniref:microviridin/marinostatin family tricyclic proteinase inhibitor n=1 Tax=Chryseobacterium sp. TaxID=1871047 RepID=UPI0025C205E6|nr:microviridin/marinostatin family tricyclic proteinase inhibitor [Chryseobacterium sp.]MBV8325735.1 microviridin/marinostatin family tricyclic proteinase inhibitor [Chryseobacterium sp.]
MENKNLKKKPFFASFLEKQLKDPETVKGGAASVTSLLKDDIMTTTALEDSATLPSNDGHVTMKYPSDSDEAGDAV